MNALLADDTLYTDVKCDDVNALINDDNLSTDVKCKFISAVDPVEVETRLIQTQSRDTFIVAIRDKLE